MELPCITLQTADRDRFLHSDGYREVTDSELETLLQQCREVAVSLEEEIENRQTISHEPPTGIKESCEKLHKSSRSIRVLGRLDVRDEKLVRAGIEIMSTEQTIRPSKVYQVFLKDILRHCGSALVLLCSASLGKHRIVSLSGPDRIALVHYVKGKRASLSSSSLDLLAEEYKIPSENSLQSAHLVERSDKRMRGEEFSSSLKPEEDSQQIDFQKRRRTEDTRSPEVLPPAQAGEINTGDMLLHDGNMNHFSLRQERENPGAHDSSSPYNGNREMKDIYTNAPASSISQLPEPFRTAVQNSRQWKWERSQDPEMKTTGCLATLFPKSYKQDASFTIWCGHNDVYHLNDMFGTQLAMSS